MNRDPLPDAYRAIQTAGSPACPPTESLVALVLGGVEEPERTRLADHVVSCRRCAADAQILFETHRESRGARQGSSRRIVAIAVAAAVLVGVAGLVLVGRRSSGQPVERGAAPRTAAAVTPADGAALRELPARFAWPAQPQAEGYRVKIHRDSGDVLWESRRVTEPAIEIPPAQRGLFQVGASYFWVVELDGPIEQKRLGPFTFRVAGSGAP